VKGKLVEITAIIEDEEQPEEFVGQSGDEKYDAEDREALANGEITVVRILLKGVYGVPRGSGGDYHLHTTFESLGGIDIGTGGEGDRFKRSEGLKYLEDEFGNLLSQMADELYDVVRIPKAATKMIGNAAIEDVLVSESGRATAKAPWGKEG
jgi:hypothetical protein